MPTITSLSPTSGPAAGGTSVTITGTGFTGPTTVRCGATAATTFTVDSPTRITAIAPGGSAGAVAVTVTTAQGTGNAVSYAQCRSPSRAWVEVVTGSATPICDT
ncbi:IPT/TIG domain-containing protein [Nocardia rhamnosiphila]